MKRRISHSEITTMLDCPAKHAFGYTGHLTNGDVLMPRTDRTNLRAGRAWGRAVYALHSGEQADSRPLTGAPLLAAYSRALAALDAELDDQATDIQERHGIFDVDAHADLRTRLAEVLWHYAATAPPLTVTDGEIELQVPIPSRTGQRRSNRFVFHGFLDALTVINGRLWIVEYKLRDNLTDYAQVVRGRQYRRYAWAAEQILGQQVAGVIVDERLSVPPKPARWVKGRKKSEGMVPSHAKDQMTTRELYEHACAEAGVDPDDETVFALDARRWQMRHQVMFRRDEIAEAGQELVSAAQQIAQLDSGVLFPVRNSAPWRCRGCAFEAICPSPQDTELVDVLFERALPKRLRGMEAEMQVPENVQERLAA